MPNVDTLGAVKNCYWTLALLVLTGGMTFSVYCLTKVYISYPVSVSISIHQEPELVFPAVTICNMSPVKKSAMSQTADRSPAFRSRKKRSAPGTGLTMLSIWLENQLTTHLVNRKENVCFRLTIEIRNLRKKN